MGERHWHELHYKARFAGIVPVYVDRLDVAGPLVVERHWSMIPLFTLVDAALGLFNFIMSGVLPEWEPAFPLRIVSRIDPPVTIECHCEECEL